MKVDTDKLLRVSSYAKRINKTPARVLQLRNEGKLDSILIDNTIFIQI